MDYVQVTYLSRHGEKTKKLSSDAKELYLAYKDIISIDLSPVAACWKLHEVHLNGNKLSQIDLSPLSNCARLNILRLEYNRLHTLDLRPLASCAYLREIDLSNNPLRLIYVPEEHRARGAILGLVSMSASTEVVTEPISSRVSITDTVRTRVLGVLRSVSKISMSDLTEYSDLSVEDTRELVFTLVGSGLVEGMFDPSEDTFVSASAVMAAKKLRSDGLTTARCAYCGFSLSDAPEFGEEVVCPSCGTINVG
ncbi:MAG: hypothetical protein ACFE8Z_03210 [Candidatus Hermodarchaeota archaeon]